MQIGDRVRVTHQGSAPTECRGRMGTVIKDGEDPNSWVVLLDNGPNSWHIANYKGLPAWWFRAEYLELLPPLEPPVGYAGKNMDIYFYA